ncbi:RE1, partial [Symbiodinium necroappetens]
MEGRQATQVHVDDMMMTGDEEPTNKVVSTLKDKYEMKVQGPFGSPGDEWNFLNRRYTVEEDFSITVRPDAKFYVDINEMLGQPRARSTPGPGRGDSLFNVDTTKPLDSADSRLFRTMVGKLLYLSNERPDAQVVIQYLASKSSCPTEQSMKILKHLPGYLYATRGYGVNVKNRAGAVSDSNFANDRETRRSLSSGQVYLNSALVYSFVRNQKVVTLSSGEAELVALTQTVSEAVLIKKAWAFIFDGPVDMIARTDSSVARAIAQRAGVGRVRHLQTSCLWIQMWTASKELKVLAIPTETNPADAGTKVLTGARLKKLCGSMGMVDGSGNLIKDDTNHKAKAGNAIKGCDNGRPDDLNYILDYLLESFYVIGYMLSMVGGGYLYVLAGIIVMILSVYLVFGARWRVTFVLENRPYTSGLGPGYADGGSTPEGAPSSASRGDAENDNTNEDQIFEDTSGNATSSRTPLLDTA